MIPPHPSVGDLAQSWRFPQSGLGIESQIHWKECLGATEVRAGEVAIVASCESWSREVCKKGTVSPTLGSHCME